MIGTFVDMTSMAFSTVNAHSLLFLFYWPEDFFFFKKYYHKSVFFFNYQNSYRHEVITLLRHEKRFFRKKRMASLIKGKWRFQRVVTLINIPEKNKTLNPSKIFHLEHKKKETSFPKKGSRNSRLKKRPKIVFDNFFK